MAGFNLRSLVNQFSPLDIAKLIVAFYRPYLLSTIGIMYPLAESLKPFGSYRFLISMLLVVAFLSSDAQEIIKPTQEDWSMDDVADWGHCYIASEHGTKWHSIKTCWSLQHSHPQSIKHLLYEKTRAMGEGKKWTSQCKICRKDLREALLAKRFRNEEERRRLIGFVEAEEKPPGRPEDLSVELSLESDHSPRVDGEDEPTAVSENRTQKPRANSTVPKSKKSSGGFRFSKPKKCGCRSNSTSFRERVKQRFAVCRCKGSP